MREYLRINAGSPKWTEEEDNLLIEIFMDGGSCSEAAEELGRSIMSVKMRKHRLRKLGKITKKFGDGRKPNIESRLTIMELIAEGKSANECAHLLGKRKSAVTKMIHRMIRDNLIVRVENGPTAMIKFYVKGLPDEISSRSVLRDNRVGNQSRSQIAEYIREADDGGCRSKEVSTNSC